MQHIPAFPKQRSPDILRQYDTFKGFVSGNPRDYKEVDDAAEKLGQSSWRAGDHVPRQSFGRIGNYVPLFDVTPFENEWTRRGPWIQATFWVLTKDMIKKVRRFKAAKHCEPSIEK